MTNSEGVADETRELFRRDGVSYRIALQAREIAEAALRGCKKALNLADRGPDPDYGEEEDERRLLMRMLRQQMRSSSPGPGSVSNGWSTWILGIVSALIVAGVVGMFAMNSRLASVETKVDMLLQAQRK